MNNEMQTYMCDNKFENYHSIYEFSSVIKNIKLLSDEYNLFVEQLEKFFNHQVESDNELKSFKGEVFELTDESEVVYFPFRVKENKLKFVETDHWKNIIMLGIVMKELKKGIEQ